MSYLMDMAEAEMLLEQLESSWQSSLEFGSAASFDFCLGGLPVSLVSTNAELLARMSRFLRHHPETSAETPLTIKLWSLEDGAVPPQFPSVLGEYRHVPCHEDGRAIEVAFDANNRALMAWDSRSQTAWWCIWSTGSLQWWEEAAPLRSVLAWALEGQGRVLVHAAAVGDTDGAVLLVGPGGSGKSSTALACHLDGLGYLGDDYCLLSVDPVATVHSLHSSAKLHVATWDLADDGPFAPVRDHLLRQPVSPEEKAVVDLASRAAGSLVEDAPVRCVAAVRVGHGVATRISDASRVEVMMALAPSSLIQIPGVGSPSLAAMVEAVRQVPVCRIDLGTDRAEVVWAMRRLLADPATRTAGVDRR